jgi:iron(III) transport system permease protein
MISPILLERPGAWRWIGVTLGFAVTLVPTVPLIRRAVAAPNMFVVGETFISALENSLVVAVAVAAVSWIVGLPAGVLAGLYAFRGRVLLVALVTLPALVPSFLWAIGWSAAALRLGTNASRALAGTPGTTLAFCGMAISIVTLCSLAVTRFLAGSQIDAARVAGGEPAVVLQSCRHAAPTAGLAAGLGGVLTLSDPGPGQIHGLRTAAGEILTSFSALYDFGLAGRQCLALAVAVLLLASPLIAMAVPRLSRQLLARQSRPSALSRDRHMSRIAAGLLMLPASILVALPLMGLVLPIIEGAEIGRAWAALTRTGWNTLLYAGGAGLVAVTIGILMAFVAGRSSRLGAACLAVALVVFVQPPALVALGFVFAGSDAPAWADPLLRSRLTVSLAMAARLYPVALVLGMRTWRTFPSSWSAAAAVHSVRLRTFLGRIVGPMFAFPAGTALLLVGLLATADVGTVLLLHPPGQASLPLTIFTVMANAPESLVASLCLVYAAAAIMALVVIYRIFWRCAR